MVASKVSILCGIVENVIFIRKLWDPGIPPMKKFSMLLANLTRMHLTKQVTQDVVLTSKNVLENKKNL